jgi:hypothetical protein
MAVIIIIADENGNQLEKINPEIKSENWEEECYQIGCKVAKTVASQYLQETEQKLFDERDKALRVKDIKQRTILTRFGEIAIQRRLYRNKKGEYCFLLDEHFNWRPNQLATPSLTSALVDSTTKLSFRKVSDEVEKYTAGVISASTVHCLLQRVAQDAIDEEKKQHKSWYKDGNIPPPGERKVSILYMEADGLWIRLQREDKNHYELKGSIAYEGWEHHSDDSYSLLNKKVYCHGDDSIPFWQLAGIHYDKYWDLGFVNLIVLGGDDADWINAGESEMGYCVRQLDGFHLSRSCCKGWEKGEEIYIAIRNGEISGDISKVIGNAKERTGKSSEKERKHILKCLDRGKDWRKKVTCLEIPQEARGLGTMEGNESNLFADRMKDRGMSWRISGAQRMGKAIELSHNGELNNWVGRRPTLVRGEEQSLNFDLFGYKDAYIEQVSMPVLYGQHASRAWVKVLKEITSLDYPLN